RAQARDGRALRSRVRALSRPLALRRSRPRDRAHRQGARPRRKGARRSRKDARRTRLQRARAPRPRRGRPRPKKGNRRAHAQAHGGPHRALHLDTQVTWYQVTQMPVVVERIQTGVRMERRMVKVLKALAEYHDLTLGDLLEGIVLHAFEGKSP